MKVIIVNKRYHRQYSTKNTIYCGRGSALGNPFPMKDESERDSVCDLYTDWFNTMLTKNYPAFHKQLARIATQARTCEGVNLECYCAPKRCHCETIKNHIETTRNKLS